MRQVTRGVLMLTLAWTAPAAAFEAGLYEVEVALEVPNIQDLGMRKVETVCVTGDGGPAHRGLAVLGDNNPLARCPASNVHQEERRLSFDIACDGKNMARARAAYELGEDSFRGRIDMNMGGKNMTMAETQLGHRIGACPRGDEAPGDVKMVK